MKSATPSLPGLVQSFFQEHLDQARGASPHTIRAYRDTLRLFFGYLARQRHCGVDRLALPDVTSQRVLDFLMDLETRRGNRPVTRNCRLAALRSWVKHLLRYDPSHADQYARILALPAKRAPRAQPDYLEPEQFRLVLDQVDLNTSLGLRDGALLLFLYNTGARVSEALQVRWSELDTTRPWQVRLHCKGAKERICPLWKQTGFITPPAITGFSPAGKTGLLEFTRATSHSGWRGLSAEPLLPPCSQGAHLLAATIHSSTRTPPQLCGRLAPGGH
jgi:integrase/recombinase XerD